MLKLLAVLPLVLVGACMGEVSADVPIAPTLSYVGPGVQVVADWETPVFFADDYYWTWSDGVWLRSSYLGGPLVSVVDVPLSVRRVHEPWGYAHYHAGAPGMVARTAPIRARANVGVHANVVAHSSFRAHRR